LRVVATPLRSGSPLDFGLEVGETAFESTVERLLE